MQTLKIYAIIWLFGFFFGGIVGVVWTSATKDSNQIPTITTPAATPGFMELDPWIQQVITDVYETAVASEAKGQSPKSWRITDLNVIDRLENNRREINCVIGASLSDSGFRLFASGSSLPDDYHRMMFHPIIDMGEAMEHRNRIARDLWGDKGRAINQYADELLRYRSQNASFINFRDAHNDIRAKEYAKSLIKQSRDDMRNLMPSLDKVRWSTVKNADGTYYHSTEHNDGRGNSYALMIITDGFGKMVAIYTESGHDYSHPSRASPDGE